MLWTGRRVRCILPDIHVFTCSYSSQLYRFHVDQRVLGMADQGIPTKEQLKKLRVVELRQRLSKLSLPQGGESKISVCAVVSRNI